MMQVPSLQRCCVSTLQKYCSWLGNVGFVDPANLRKILSNCSAQELATIEDETLDHSSRDLTWYTWDLWQELYTRKFGRAREGLQPPAITVDPPEDYLPPTPDAEPANWREAFYTKLQQQQEMLARIGQQSKALYEQEKQDRESKQTQVLSTIRKEPGRARALPGAVKRPATAGNPAAMKRAKLMKTIGLRSTPTSRGPPPRVTITRTTNSSATPPPNTQRPVTSRKPLGPSAPSMRSPAPTTRPQPARTPGAGPHTHASSQHTQPRPSTAAVHPSTSHTSSAKAAAQLSTPAHPPRQSGDAPSQPSPAAPRRPPAPLSPSKPSAPARPAPVTDMTVSRHSTASRTHPTKTYSTAATKKDMSHLSDTELAAELARRRSSGDRGGGITLLTDDC